MKKILIVISLCVLSLGCTPKPSAVSGPEKTYDLMGKEVTFAIPSAPWVEKTQTIGPEQADLGMPAETIVGITFRRPDKEGLIAVGALGQQQTTDGKFVDIENDQETLNQIANWVEKRDGKRLEEEYIKVLGTNAFHMTFEVGEDNRKEKGEQVHFTKDGKHYSLSILVPAQDYKSEVGHFRNLVASFKID